MTGTAFPFPEGFLAVVAPLLGDGLGDFIASYRHLPRRALRFSGRGPRPAFLPNAQAVPWAQNAVYLEPGQRPGAHALHWAGAFYVQEPSAMAAAAALFVQAGDRVLDLCAAPGGKAGQLSENAGPEGFLLANDPVYPRALELSRNLERLGAINAAVTCAEPAALAQRFPNYFDKILVDAPCSGEGMFKKEPAALERWHPGLPAASARLQAEILLKAGEMLRPGGLLVYSTCTFNPVENEGVVEGFLRARPDFSLRPFSLHGLPAAATGLMRLWPHQVPGEGHFIALLQKEAGGPESPARLYETRPHPLLAQVNAALGDWVEAPKKADAVFGSTAVALPRACPSLDGLNLLRLGLHLGGLTRKTPRPDHALALAVPALNTLEVDEALAERFRLGEVLEAPPTLSGFAAPRLQGWQLGWGKASQGTLKNHYPKGLRRFSLPEQ